MANLELPTPSPGGQQFDASPSLSERINIATRSVHSQLNKLILVRLPLALPPYTSSPSIYATGLLHVAPIYITFESLWQAILDLPCLPAGLSHIAGFDDNQEGCSFQGPKPMGLTYSRERSLLSHLYLPGLLRAQRLRTDIKDLTGFPESEIEGQLDISSGNGKLAEFVAHTKKTVGSSPHVLLAYAWVFYMALFSGGRYLRAALAEAGGEGTRFWALEPSVTPVLEEHIADRSSARSKCQPGKRFVALIPGLQFFNFAGDFDGEDIKLEFKRRIAEVENLLTSGEKEHIIAEAENIFKYMVEIVLELDKVISLRTGGTLSVCEAGLNHPYDRVDIQKERVEQKPPSKPQSKGGPASSPSNEKGTRYLPWKKWVTSLLPMVLCIVLTSWYYGM
ncbi:heme oxygenase-like protein [Hyaloscypha variabilis]